MRFINIGDTKLKVILTPEECVKYGIDTTKSDFSRGEIRGIIRDIASAAEQECSFRISNEKILIQLYPMPSGECELFVTKLTGLLSKDKTLITGYEGLATMQKRKGIYRFESMELLSSAVRSAHRAGVESELYRDKNGRYYITVSEEFTDGISEFEIFIEYGERLSNMPIYVLSEYGELLIAEGAMDMIYHSEYKNGEKD